jgi:tRNA(Ile)-lysidine synthase
MIEIACLSNVRNALHSAGVSGPVIVAVSGGADSMAMLRATLVVADELQLWPIVAHLDHGLRHESAEDARWVVGQAEELDAEAVTARADVGAIAAESGRGLEETARRLRYTFLAEVAVHFGAATILTAHTAEDLAETVLHHVLRGTGLQGLRGIARRRKLTPAVTLLRPLLDVRRTEVEAYLAEIGQPFLTDASNADVVFTRNRLRHSVLPMLRESVNPSVIEALLRLSRQADETASLVRRLARRELRRVEIESSAEIIRLNSRRLRTRPRALIRETIVLAWRRSGWPRQAMSFRHWDALAEIVVSGGRRTLPGGTDARRRRGELILSRRQK